MENGPSFRKSYLRRYEGTYLIIRTFEVPSYSMYLRIHTFEGTNEGTFEGTKVYSL